LSRHEEIIHCITPFVSNWAWRWCVAMSVAARGRHSYGDIQVMSWGEGCNVRVGNFCSIAGQVVAMVPTYARSMISFNG
jgi:hypothetical protein